MKTHPFHLVKISPWPILTSFALMFTMIGFVLFIREYYIGYYLLPIALIILVFLLYSWWRDIINEGLSGHCHSTAVQMGLKIGMVLFILSEIMLFFTIFFAYFFSSINPVGELEGVWLVGHGHWPPSNIILFDPWSIPFINSLILLLSGTSVTWAHHAIILKNKSESIRALGITVLLGIFFTSFQIYEYVHAKFGMSDGIYASNFYFATGFHGIHVVIGIVFLSVCYFRAKRGDFIQGDHLGFEFAAWYWHFVDVVWLFLFIFIYVIPS
ncbi:cytochrome c oxidase subunit 3 [Rickettsia endosymbiont of Cardiosporidium cionae]|uniref:cytochrome c oxidase subunit 3 n=1 Tax=Rickettsia endosymbiont of Cardiosporidium cionae TaxID=2777155 RepID=UPI0018956FD2|nr:cytochrome c oxidase subunit 3 [Rickettsia endosymbiont of Cardiosporidium cionae]KAF8818416.1 cytochrome c oxidase subunit 3 [Rickettsia endosymbiont of Cardiosporidium cionae]